MITGKVMWSEGTYRLFGYEPFEVEPSLEKYLSIIHPDDVVALKIQLDAMIHSGDSLEHEFRIIDRQNNIRHVNSKVVVHRNAAGMALRVIGFNIDISELKKQTREIESQNKRLKEIAWMQSHEVRGPLARMMGLISLVTDFKQNGPNLKELLDNVVISAKELDVIIRNIVRKTEQIEK